MIILVVLGALTGVHLFIFPIPLDKIMVWLCRIEKTAFPLLVLKVSLISGNSFRFLYLLPIPFLTESNSHLKGLFKNVLSWVLGE